MESTRGKRESNIPDLKANLKACLVSVLRQNSISGKPLSVQKIYSCLKKEAYLITGEDFNVSMPTIRKSLEQLYEFSSLFRDLFCLTYGGYLHKYFLSPSSTKGHPVFLPVEQYEEFEYDLQKASNIKTFFSFESQFQPQELFTLLSCIEVNPYLSVKEVKSLRDKLKIAGTPDLVRQCCTESCLNANFHTDSISVKLLTNIATLITQIHNQNQIEICYGKYIANPLKSGYSITPTHTTKNGLPKWQRIDPISIFEANGFYYLVAHTDKSTSVDDLIHYRIDRIISIRPYKGYSVKPLTISKDILSYRNTFSALDYKKSHPVMYSGDKTDIHLLVMEDKTFNPINALLDTFGQTIMIHPVTDEISIKYLHSTLSELSAKGECWYSVHLNHSISGTVLWAKQHIEHVLLISPQEIVDLLITSVQTGLNRY